MRTVVLLALLLLVVYVASRRYNLTKHVPWHLVKYLFQQFRRRLYERPPNGPWLEYDIEVDTAHEVLAKNHFANWHKLSYYVRGEDLNMRRIETLEDGDFLQSHVRGWETENGMRFSPHRELDQVQHPNRHLDREDFSYELGVDTIREIFDEYELVDEGEW